MPIDRIIRMPELCMRMGKSKSNIYRMRNSGELTFVKIGVKAVGVKESELNRWFESLETVEPEQSDNDGTTGEAA